MNTIQSSYINGSEYTQSFNNLDHKEDYLRKTIEVKNKNIDELLKQLRQTKELYQQYKSQYLNEEKKLKTKVTELNNKLDIQYVQLQKYKHLCNKMKGDIQLSHDKQQKTLQSFLNQSKELTSIRTELDEKCKNLLKENTQLKQRNDYLTNKNTKLDQKLTNSQQEINSYRQELKRLRQEMIIKQTSWTQERKQLREKFQQKQIRKEQKIKTNQRLNLIENKIKENLRMI